MAEKPCRSVQTFKDLLGRPRDAAKRLPWESVCDAVFCITTRRAGKARWKGLKGALERADLARLTRFVVSEEPCGLSGEKCHNPVLACFASHVYAVQLGLSEGYDLVLVLEDDVYFDEVFLEEGIARCSEFLDLGLEFSAFLFGGVYLGMTRTDVVGVYAGKAVQSHAWLLNVKHPVWTVDVSKSKTSMVDFHNYDHGVTYMLHPAVAFQQYCKAPGGTSSVPPWPLDEFPLLYRVLTRLGMSFGARNCWEKCSRRTNWTVEAAGSVGKALVGISVAAAALLILVTVFIALWVSSLKHSRPVS